MEKHNKIVQIIAVLPLLLFIGYLFLSDLDDLSNFNGDENIWIYVGHVSFKLFFLEHNYNDPFWNDDFYAYGAFNPPIGKYIIGLGTHIRGYSEVEYKVIDWRQSFEWNVQHGRALDSQVIKAGRIPIATLGVLSCVFLYLFTCQILDWITAYITTCFFIASRLVLDTGRVAMTDMPALSFTILSIALIPLLLKSLRSSSQKIFFTSFFIGLSTSFAIGSKVNAALVGIVFAIVLCIEFFIRVLNRISVKPVVYAGSVMFITCLLFFYLFNPFLYPNPIKGVQHMLDFATLVRDTPSSYKVSTLSEKIAAIQDNTLRYAPLHRAGLPGDRLLQIGGLISAIWYAGRYPKEAWERGFIAALVWIGVMFVGITLWLPNSWARYTLQLQPCIALLEGFAVTQGLYLLHTAQQYAKRE